MDEKKSVLVLKKFYNVKAKTDKAVLLEIKNINGTQECWVPRSRIQSADCGLEIESWLLKKREIETVCISCEVYNAEVGSLCSFCYSISGGNK